MHKIKTMTALALPAIAFGLAVSAMPARASQLDGAQYLKDAKITLKQARQTAMKTVHGKIVSEELEKESGGSGLRYSFDIKVPGGKLHEVGVDAKTGKVLEDSIEGKDAD